MRNYYTLTENFLHSSKIPKILIVQGMDINKNARAGQKTSFIFFKLSRFEFIYNVRCVSLNFVSSLLVNQGNGSFRANSRKSFKH